MLEKNLKTINISLATGIVLVLCRELNMFYFEIKKLLKALHLVHIFHSLQGTGQDVKQHCRQFMVSADLKFLSFLPCLTNLGKIYSRFMSLWRWRFELRCLSLPTCIQKSAEEYQR